jgi:predicted amidophosphoribosyltransferase
MTGAILLNRSLSKGVLITHVPATAAHIRERGYDQAALLARQLARRSGAQHAALLARSGKSHQLGATRYERLEQLKYALRTRQPDLIHGQRILLVDDVLTTGASIRAATAALQDAGAATVDVLVFAQAFTSNAAK